MRGGRGAREVELKRGGREEEGGKRLRRERESGEGGGGMDGEAGHNLPALGETSLLRPQASRPPDLQAARFKVIVMRLDLSRRSCSDQSRR